MSHRQDNKLISDKIIPWIIFAAACVAYILFLSFKAYQLIDSDISSEMLLGNLLAEEHKLFTRNWYYSTEFRVLNEQIVISFVFPFFRSWRVIRVVSTLIVTAIMLLSCYALCNALGKKEIFPYVGTALILPFSNDYVTYHIIGSNNMPYTIFTFSALALLLSVSKTDSDSKKKRIVLCLISFAIAGFSGMNGPRQLAVLYTPMLVASVLLLLLHGEEKTKFDTDFKPRTMVLVAAGNLLCNGAGYLMNLKVLPRWYHYQKHHDTGFVGFRWESFRMVLKGFLVSFGFREDVSTPDVVISNIIVVMFYITVGASIVILIRKWNDVSIEIKMAFLYLSCAVCCFVGMYSLTETGYSDRYNLPFLVVLFPLVFYVLSELTPHFSIIRYLSQGLLILLAISGIIYYGVFIREDRTAYHREMAGWLEENGYYNGYATFWNGNVINELTNGRVEMYTLIGEDMALVDDIDQRYRWLQRVSHDTNQLTGKVFIIFTPWELEACKWKDNMRRGDVVFENDDGTYMIFGYESYEVLCDLIQGE